VLLLPQVQKRKLEAERQRVKHVIDKEEVAIRALLVQNRKRDALLCLKKKKWQENMMTKLDESLLDVEKALVDLQNTRQNITMVKVMRESNAVLRRMQSEISADDVARMIEETAEHQAWLHEVDSIFASSLEMDPNAHRAIEDELAAIERGLNLESSGEIELPDVPTGPVVVKKKRIDEEEPAAETETSPAMLPA